MLAVVVTANHYWLDGIAAALLLALALIVQRVARIVRAAYAARAPLALPISRTISGTGPPAGRARKPVAGERVAALGRRWPDRKEAG